ncbi:hypothetical protein BDP81DRAFT_46307 [Colletotrichum phormii]|uniref:Fungal N-terminal domain-containing protein n=1 Tax=Colletotrichum phormii TaxID=359342 RepID=A0AAI9ZNB7_9PEZI|nr:uncharacterized protein BDP81DRAFT_46307 [Colletotrichum phormii]KAK1635172.1 hypothetical protein BDP81DRAFT_46307 [Colletotrichum phormii]
MVRRNLSADMHLRPMGLASFHCRPTSSRQSIHASFGSSSHDAQLNMDPLSTAASIIALIQASAAVGKGVKILLSLRHAPADFCELVDELTALQDVIEQVKSPLQELEKGDIALPTLN